MNNEIFCDLEYALNQLGFDRTHSEKGLVIFGNDKNDKITLEFEEKGD